jgi:hypothetical protein
LGFGVVSSQSSKIERLRIVIFDFIPHFTVDSTVVTVHGKYSSRELKQQSVTVAEYKEHINVCISQLQIYKEKINLWYDPKPTESIINVDILIEKVQQLLNPIKKSWKIIFAILACLGVIAGASNGFIVISGIISKLLNYIKLI